MRRLGLILSTAVMLVGTTGALAADLTIWWTKGTTEVEDNTLKEIVARWEKETGKTAELSFYATGDTEAKVLTALKAGSPPDLTFDFGFDLAYTPTWAFEDQLADLTSVIEPVKARSGRGEAVPELAGMSVVDAESGLGNSAAGDGAGVTAVERGSTAWNLGLRPGDRIVGVNRRRVGSVQELVAALKAAGRPVTLNVVRGDFLVSLMIKR